MDFPKSVPGNGLQNGQFVDEDPANGIIGSLIPAGWSNGITNELINLVKAAGLEPDEADHGQVLQAVNQLVASQVESKQVLQFSAGTQLTAANMGLLLLDSSTANSTYTLPPVTPELGIRDVILRRTDNTGHRLVVQVSGDDKIKFHTHLRAEGYPFLVLMGAGDYWHLRSDGAGNWWLVSRLDDTPLGRPVFETTLLFNPGGYGALSGAVLSRAEWPWLFDHAQQSGMFTTEAERVGMEGGWTSGDGVATFRGPEGRGEFLRVLDENRGVDSGRKAGSSQASQNLLHGHGASSGSAGAHTHPVSGTAAAAGNHRHSMATGDNEVSNGFVGDEGRGNAYTRYTNYDGEHTHPVTGTAASAGAHAHPVTVNADGGGEARPRSIAYPGRIKLI